MAELLCADAERAALFTTLAVGALRCSVSWLVVFAVACLGVNLAVMVLFGLAVLVLVMLAITELVAAMPTSGGLITSKMAAVVDGSGLEAVSVRISVGVAAALGSATDAFGMLEGASLTVVAAPDNGLLSVPIQRAVTTMARAALAPISHRVLLRLTGAGGLELEAIVALIGSGLLGSAVGAFFGKTIGTTEAAATDG